jgi:hypothetical protein
LNEDTTLYNALNLDEIFFDFDGDKLEYTYGELEHINLILHENGSVDISGRQDWFGEELIKITATDPFGLFFSFVIEVIILSVNDPPVLNHIEDIVINENDTIVLNPVIKDVDSNYIETRSSWPNFTGTWQTDFFSAGNYQMNISVTDGEAEDWQWFNITVINVNRLPIKKFLSLLVGPITIGDRIDLRAEFLDPDDDHNGNGFIDNNETSNLTYTWIMGDGTYLTDDEISYIYEKPGDYKIVLIVTDGDNESVEFSIGFSVEDKSNIGILKMILITISAVSVITFCSIVFIIISKKKRAYGKNNVEPEDNHENIAPDRSESAENKSVKRIKKTVRKVKVENIKQNSPKECTDNKR